MNEQITARECVKALCSAWFERRSMEETIVFFADDVMFIGTGEGESAHGKNEMANYITQDIQEIPEPFTVGVTIVHEQQIGEIVCLVPASTGVVPVPCKEAVGLV